MAATCSAENLDVRSYQDFWENVDPATLERHRGKFVALTNVEGGWRIVEAAENFGELHDLLANSGISLNECVFDRVHTEDSTATGAELQ